MSLEKIKNPNLYDLLSDTDTIYHNEDAACNLRILSSTFNEILNVSDKVEVIINTSLLAEGCFDPVVEDEFGTISIHKHELVTIYKRPEVYAMRPGRGIRGCVYILTSIGIITILESQVHTLKVVRYLPENNQQYSIQIKLLNGDSIALKFQLK